jgi:hypothetical protein
MSSEPTTSDPFDQAIADMPSCALDETGLREQRARYVSLSPSVTRLEREPEAVVIEFREGFDQATLEQALAVERECCPFFKFDFDEAQRRLRATVRDVEQLPALDAMAHALESGTRRLRARTGGVRTGSR